MLLLKFVNCGYPFAGAAGATLFARLPARPSRLLLSFCFCVLGDFFPLIILSPIKRLYTESDGWAPFDSQYLMRSLFSFFVLRAFKNQPVQ